MSRLLHRILLVALSSVGILFTLRSGFVVEQTSLDEWFLALVIFPIGLFLLLVSYFDLKFLFESRFLVFLVGIFLPFSFLQEGLYQSFFSILLDCLKYIYVGWFLFLIYQDMAKIEEKYFKILLLLGTGVYFLLLVFNQYYTDLLIVSLFILSCMFIIVEQKVSRVFCYSFLSSVGVILLALLVFFAFYQSNYEDLYRSNVSSAIFSNISGKGVGQYLISDGLLTKATFENFTLLVATEMFGIWAFCLLSFFFISLAVGMLYYHLKNKQLTSLVAFFISFVLVLEFLLHCLSNFYSVSSLEVRLPLFSGGYGIISSFFAFALLFSLTRKEKQATNI